MKLSRDLGKQLLPWVGILILYAVLRLINLDQSFHFDERLWLARSINFFKALTAADFEQTYQREHPGVLTTWAGTFAYIIRYPELPSIMQSYFPHDGAANRLWELGYNPRELLIAARVAKVLMQVAVFAIFLRYLFLLVGRFSTMLTGILIAVSPTLIYWDAWLHVDGLATIGAAATVTATAYAAERTNLAGSLTRSTTLHWAVAGTISSIAWMSRITLLSLVGVMGLALLIQLFVQLRKSSTRQKLAACRRAITYGIVWVLSGIAGAFLLLPALWVDPGTVISEVLLLPIRGVQGTESEFFSENHVVESWWYYPVEFLLRTTEFEWLGMLALLIGGFAATKAGYLSQKTFRLAIIAIIFSIVFILGNSISPKKFDRYIMPVYPLATMIASFGFSIAWNWLQKRQGIVGRGIGRISVAIIIMLPLLTTVTALPHKPNYYNPFIIAWTERELGYPIDMIQLPVMDTLQGESNTRPIVVDLGELSFPMPLYLSPDRDITLRETPIDSPADWYETDFQVVDWTTPNRDLFYDSQPYERYEINGVLVAELYAPHTSPLPEDLHQPTACSSTFGDNLTLLEARTSDEAIELYFVGEGQGTYEIRLTTEQTAGVFTTETTMLEMDSVPNVVQPATFSNPVASEPEVPFTIYIEVFSESGEPILATAPWNATASTSAIIETDCYSHPTPDALQWISPVRSV